MRLAFMLARVAAVTLVISGFLFAQSEPARLDQHAGPLSIARQGSVFAGGKYSTVDGRQAMSGQIYAEFQIPSKMLHPNPIVMIHGGGQTGTNFTGTPDGREGWAQFFLRQGYAVYVIDQPGRGRAAYPTEIYGPLSPAPNPETIQQRFTSIERYNSGHKLTCTRNGPAMESQEMQSSTSSSHHRYPAFRTSHDNNCSTVMPLCPCLRK